MSILGCTGKQYFTCCIDIQYERKKLQLSLPNIYICFFFFFGHIAYGVFTELKSLKGFQWIQNFPVLF